MDQERATVEPWRVPWFGAGAADYQLTRFVLLRALGFVYLVAFLVSALQIVPLIGAEGLIPAGSFLERVREHSDSAWNAWLGAPSLFWLGCSDRALSVVCWSGVALSTAVLLGMANLPLMFTLWVLYSSIVNVGQTFYGYGWEILLLEAGFLAIFLCPTWRLTPRSDAVPPLPVIWLYRWLIFRVMFGAGLIKLRGDPCWSDLSCLFYHYETQPNPHPLSWVLHQAPDWFHRAGVLFNHLVEVVAPWFVFGARFLGGRRARHAAGAAMVAFQIFLIASGNLSFLNWLTAAIALACFDDGWLRKIVPRALAERIVTATPAALSVKRRRLTVALVAVVAVLSLNPIGNLFEARQRMNASFDPLHLVNTYGAFGSVGRERYEIALEGSSEELGPHMAWQEYEFPCKPGDVSRLPCWVTPYHYRLDWQMWFASQSSYREEPWIIHLAERLLRGDEKTLSLLRKNPFPDAPPRYLRALLYRYEFTQWGEPSWWRRELLGDYFGATSLEDPSLQRFLDAYGWLR